MKVLQLCNKPPLPAMDGGCLAMNNITQGILDLGVHVRLLTIFTDKHPYKPELFPKDYASKTRIHGIYADTKVNAVDAFSTIVTRDSYNISRFFSVDFDICLARVLQEEHFDVIHLESLFMAPYIRTLRKYSKAKIVLRSHNLEYMIWERMASRASGFRKLYLRFLARGLKKYEIKTMNIVDGIAAISAEDANRFKQLGCTKPVITIPFGVNLADYQIDHSKEEDGSLFHLGSMDWLPNKEAAEWLLDGVWTSAHRKAPLAHLYLAGRRNGDVLDNNLPDGVTMVGEVENAQDFIRSKSVMLVPVKSGGGVRIKIIEGLALGKAIVSTKVGAEGIDVVHNEHILIADEPEKFAELAAQATTDKELRAKLGINARNLVETKYNNKDICKSLLKFYTDLCA